MSIKPANINPPILQPMNTFFASPERTDQKKLADEIELASKNPVISGLLSSVGGLLAVLDEQRQIVSINDEFLLMLGIDDPALVLGLRPGEALGCIHANEGPGGCGTSKFCSSCGAALAIVASLERDEPVERICALSAVRGDKAADAALLVRARPLHVDMRRFLLLFVQDITRQQQRAALERTFFHDINNMLGLLAGAAELMALEDGSPLAETVRRTSMRLSREVAVHRHLLQDQQSAACQPIWNQVSAGEILDELRSFFSGYSLGGFNPVEFPEAAPDVFVRTDMSLLLRVLCNMVTNAVEASQGDVAGGVKVWIEQALGTLSFCVWNAQEIPPEKARRVFQLYFSTKAEAGRGIGTYSMKLIGEKLLGGQVSFSTSRKDGTVFRCSVPVQSKEMLEAGGDGQG